MSSRIVARQFALYIRGESWDIFELRGQRLAAYAPFYIRSPDLERPHFSSKHQAAGAVETMSKAPVFIVSHYIFAEQQTFAIAEAERVRLSKLFPKKKFKVYCVLEDFDNPECKDPNRKSKIKAFPKAPKERPEKPKITLANFKEKRQSV